MTVLLTVLIGLMIVAAVIALEAKERLSSIVALGAVGFLVSVAFLLLGAPDVAKTQIVVEILSLLLLLRVTAGGPEDRGEAADAERPGVGALIAALSAALIVAGAGVYAYATYPSLGNPAIARVEDAPSLFYLQQGLSETGSANVVASVLLDFRGYDTLGEVTVLFCAVIGTLSLLRKRTRPSADEGAAS